MMPMPKDSIAQPSDLVRPRHVGMPIRRTEDPRLLTGNGEYSADRKPDHALHVAFRRSSESHALIVRVEVSQAKAAPGVIDVLTADDVVGDFKPVIPFSRMANYYATPILPLAAGKGSLCRRGHRGGDCRIPLSRRGRGGADRHRIRAARRGLRS